MMAIREEVGRRSFGVIGGFLCLLLLGASLARVGAAAESPAVDRFDIFEKAFNAEGDYANPYTGLEAEAEIRRPDGTTWNVPLFWDGGKTWKMRVSPDFVGNWTWRVRSADTGLNGQSGQFECRASKRRGSVVPMPSAPRHFQYQDGTPMWFMGDTAWGLYTDDDKEKHHRAQVEHYIDTRAGQGFTAMHSMLLSEAGLGNPGGPPFRDIGEEKINPAYWREVDERLAYVNSHGIIGGLAIAWGDKRKVEPYAWRRFPGIEARKRYARFIAARYSAFDVYFIVSGEWHGEVRTRSGVTEEQIMREFVDIGNTLADSDPHGRMVAIHPMTQKGSVREFCVAPWMSFADYQQNYRDLHGRILLSQRIGRPVVNSEYGYYLRDQNGDGATDKSNSYTVDDIRHASWDIVTAGGYFVTGFGTTYFAGHRDPGPFDVDAEKNDIWEEQTQYIPKFFTGLPWWKLVPADELLSADKARSGDNLGRVKQGNRTVSGIRPPDTTYWAMTIPSETYVLYVRGLDDAVRLELDSREGDFRVRLYNPREGTYKELEKARIKTDYRFRPPTAEDWIVLLQRIGLSDR